MFKQIPISNVLLDQDKDVLYTYCFVSCYCNHVNFDEVYFSPETLDLYGKLNKHSYFKKNLNILAEMDMIKTFNSKYYIVNKDNFYKTDEPFVFIEDAAFFKIINSSYQNKSMLLKLYVEIIKSLNYNWTIDDRNGVVGTMPQNYFAERCGITSVAVNKNISILCDLKLIHIIHRGFDVKKNCNHTNLYCRYVDRNVVADYLNSDVDKSYAKLNEKRKTALKYNRFLKNPKRYSKSEIMELIDECKAYNKQTSRVDKIKNISILEQYLV